MERFGLRQVVSAGSLLIAAAAGLSGLALAAWQLVLTWGMLIGLGTESMALVFAATLANAWFVKRRGLVMGVLTAGGAAGQAGVPASGGLLGGGDELEVCLAAD
jgi:MFS family permease